MDHTRLLTSRKWARALVPLLATFSALSVLPRVARVEPTALPDELARVSESVAGLPQQVATAAVRTVSSTGRHLGFDTNLYPGDAALAAWREAGPYEWVGYYLPAPCHKDDSWSGKRETIAALGFGTAVIYVGQQAWGRTTNPAPAQARRARGQGKVCDAAYMGAAQGRVEANDAIAKTAAEGFAEGTVIFLDVERMERVPQAMRDYYRAWTARVLEDGRFRPGVYVHKHNATLIYDDLKAEFAEAGVNEEPAFWVASGRGFRHATSEPTDVGHQFTTMWQGLLDIVETHGGVRLPIDVNVAAVRSPSEQYATVAVRTPTSLASSEAMDAGAFGD